MTKRKQVITGDSLLSSNIRHALTLGAGILIGLGYVDADQQQTLVDAALELLSQSEIIMGLLLYGSGVGASRANKKR